MNAQPELAQSQGHMCAYLIARVIDMPRDEFGDQHVLATEAAYRRVERLLLDELRRARDGLVRGDLP